MSHSMVGQVSHGTVIQLSHGVVNQLSHGMVVQLINGMDGQLSHAMIIHLTYSTVTQLSHGTVIQLSHGMTVQLIHGMSHRVMIPLLHNTVNPLPYSMVIHVSHGLVVMLPHSIVVQVWPEMERPLLLVHFEKTCKAEVQIVSHVLPLWLLLPLPSPLAGQWCRRMCIMISFHQFQAQGWRWLRSPLFMVVFGYLPATRHHLGHHQGDVKKDLAWDMWRTLRWVCHLGS